MISTSCSFLNTETADKNTNADWQIILIEKSENPVELRVTGSPVFEGMRDIINGSTVRDGNICKVNTSAETGNYFGGSYDVEGENTRNARYIMTPMGFQRHNPIQLGVNYFTVAIEATFWQADSVEIQFNSDITIRNLNGKFDILVSVWREDDWFVETPLTRFTGTLEKAGDITVSFTKDEYLISSTSEISRLTVEGYDSWRTSLTKATAENNSNGYIVKSVGSQYIISEKEITNFSNNTNIHPDVVCNCPCIR
jgi:hypothetical protein